MSVKNEADGVPIIWTDEYIVSFCDVCIDFITKNGRGQSFRWRDIQDQFTDKIGKKCYLKSLKNKYDSMKKDWRLWKYLKRGETGLGWNSTTGKLDCSDEWWEKKLKEKPEAKKFRFKGLSPLVEERWDHLFGDAVATGESCVAPSLTPEFVDQPVSHVDLCANNFIKFVFLFLIGKYYIVDKGYPDRKGYLAPYSRIRYHQSQFEHVLPTNAKEAFNRVHSSLRSCIERSFGVLKKRWKILNRMPRFSETSQIDVIMATFALHNYIRRNDAEDMVFNIVQQHRDYIPMQELDGETSFNQGNMRGSNNEMREIRNNIANMIWSANNVF